MYLSVIVFTYDNEKNIPFRHLEMKEFLLSDLRNMLKIQDLHHPQSHLPTEQLDVAGAVADDRAPPLEFFHCHPHTIDCLMPFY